MRCPHPALSRKKISSGSVVCFDCRSKVGTCIRQNKQELEFIEKANKTVYRNMAGGRASAYGNPNTYFKERYDWPDIFQQLETYLHEGLWVSEALRKMGVNYSAYVAYRHRVPEQARRIDRARKSVMVLDGGLPMQ